MNDIVYGFKIGIGVGFGLVTIYGVVWGVDQLVALLIRKYGWSVARWWDCRKGECA